MAKKDSDINNRIKKITPDNKWIVNVGKSLGFTTNEIIQDLLPNTTDFVNWNKREMKNVSDMVSNIRTNHTGRSVFNKQFSNIPQIKAAQEFFTNMKDDLKSGKLYNKEREAEITNYDDIDFGFGNSLFSEDDRLEFIDDDEELTSSQSRPPVTVINTMPLAKAIESSGNATVSTMINIAEQQMSVETEKIMFSQRNADGAMNALGAINDNLSLLVKFNADSTAKYHAAAMKYYEQSLEILEASQHKERDEVFNPLNPFSYKGNIKFGKYVEIVKKNLLDIKDDSPVASQIVEMFTDTSNLKEMSKNPMGFLTRLLSTQFMPASIRDTFGKLDEGINSILPAILAKINTFDGSRDQTLQKIFDVLGYKSKLDYGVDLGDYHKGSMSWDGESKKALVEVIPAYLRRIESALTGNEERVFNFSSGKFVDHSQLLEDWENKKIEEEVSGYLPVINKLKRIATNMDLNEESMLELEKMMNEYFSKTTQTGRFISPVVRKNSRGKDEDDFKKYLDFGLNKEKSDLFKRLLSGLSEQDFRNIAGQYLLESRTNAQELMEDIRFDPNKYGYSTIYQDSDEFDNPRVAYKPNPKGLTDEFGLSQLDYLRDIRKALIDGIKVFPDTRQRYSEWEPNSVLKAKEKQEEANYQTRLETERDINTFNYPFGGTKTFKDLLKAKEEEWEAAYERKPAYDFSDNAVGKSMYYINKAGDKLNEFSHEILFGSEEYPKQILEGLKKAGKTGKGAIQHLKDMFSDTAKAFKAYFTGQPYETSDGIRVEANPNSIFNSMKKFFTGAYDKLSKGEDGEGGIIQKFARNFMDGFEQFKVSLFGEKKLSEKAGKESSQNILQKIKARLPKAFAAGYGSALVKSVFASNLGILGNFIMPGGPLAAILTGTAFNFLKQSETFQTYMFGEKDEEGNRVGGLISKAWQDKYKENKSAIKKGAAVGLLGSLFLPGGPVTGALMGIGTSFIARNDSFQKFLFGDNYKEDEKKSLMNGTFGRIFKRLSNDNENPGLAAFLGAGGLGIGVAQGIGLLPSFLLPGGPVMGALLGLAGGITASSNKFQEFLLGEKDVDGQRYGGLLHRVTNWFDLTFTQPLKIKATEINDKIHGFLRKKLFDPIARSFEPIAYAVKNMAIHMKDKVVDTFTNMVSPIVESFKDHVTRPLGKALKKALINPIKKIFGGVFKLVGKLLLNVATFPLKGINLLGAVAEGYNKKEEIRKEKRRRGKEYDKAHKDDGTWNKADRKAAQHMTKEEKEQLWNEKLPYRDGKTRRQRKKEQKADYKDDMLKRKERLDEMQRQFEEDKKFAKENGFKFKSKKQKEQREQELREKEIWYQEQQLLKAQDTDEKVSKIADNVIEFPKQNDKVVDKLGEVKDTLVDGFNKLMGKPSEPKPEQEQSPNNVIPFHQGGDYGKVSDEDLDKVYNAGKSPDQPTMKGQLKEAWDGFFKDVKDLKQTIKDTKDSKNESELIDTDKVTDLDLKEKFIKINKKYENRLKGQGKVIDINKKLQDEDHSHKDGLDLVPNDGYIAELHKGEMVVPEKPAGKLRGLMDKVGKGFSGLADALDETSKDDIDHREEESGVVEDSLIKGALSFGNIIASAMGNAGNMFGKLAKNDVKDREDNALQLSDMEADRLKEIEDKARYEHASRKGVDYVQEKSAAKEKEKAEKNWKDKLLSAVHGVGSSMRDAGMNIFSLLGKGFNWITNGGLSTLLGSVLAAWGLGSLMEYGDDYQETDEYIEGHTDADGSLVTDNYDLVKYRTMWGARSIFKAPITKLSKKIAKSKLYNSKFGKKFLQPIGNKISGAVTKFDNKVGSVVQTGKEFLFGKKPTKTVAKAAGTVDNVVDLAAYKAAKNGAKIADVADTKIIKGAADSAASKKLSKLIGKTADEGGLVHKVVQWGKVALEKIGEYAATKFPKLKGLGKKLAGCADNIFGLMLKNSDNILAKFSKKIAALIGKVTAGASTAFILDAAFAVGDLATGFTAGNAGNLFGVSPENVDARMRIISSIMQAVFNFNIMGVISLINEITNMIFNFNFLRNIAIWLYNITGGKQDLSSRILPEQIDTCTSIEQALQIMGITDPNDIMMLKDGNDWKDFSKVENEELGGVITPSEQIELARLQYNLANGTKLNSQAFIDKTSKTVGTKFMEMTKKLFTGKTAQEKYDKLTSKADKKQAKADEYAEKAKNSKTFLGKVINSGMAKLNQKSADKAKKKSEKLVKKADKKVAKAQNKLSYHQEKAQTSKGLFKWYHNWRANANQKKIDKYTMTYGIVTPDGSSPTEYEAPEPTQEQVPILSKEYIQSQYPNIPEGKIVEDGYGNRYDHDGNLVYTPNSTFMSNNALEWGHAGMGDGEDILVNPDGSIVGEQKTGKGTKKKSSKVGKVAKFMFPGASALHAGIKAGKKLFGKKEKPEDYQMIPVMDADGNILSYTKQLIDETTEIKGYGGESLQVEVRGKNTQVIPQMDAEGNVVSYTTLDKNSSKGKSLLSRLGSAVGSFFGLTGSTTSNSTSSSVDNSSTITNNTGDEYITNNTTEIDTTPFGPLTDAINNLVESNGNDNIDEEGNIKSGGILNIIMDPMGYLTKKLTNYGINIYEDLTGDEVDMEKVNKGVSIFNILRNPFGYLASVIDGTRDTNNDGTKDISFIDASKNWAGQKWNDTTEWAGNAWNSTKNWFNEKSQPIIEWGKHQYNKTDDVADIIMGDDKARPNILTTGISVGSDIATKVWNSLATEDMQLAETDIADFVATFINKAFVKPFQELANPVSEKFNEAKEAVSNWIGERKSNIYTWYTEEFKPGLEKSKEGAKKTQQALLDDVNKAKNAVTGWFSERKESFYDWYTEEFKPGLEKSSKAAKKTQQAIIDDVKERKDNIMNWYSENIGKPLEKSRESAKKTQQAILNDVTRTKDNIMNWFSDHIGKPIKNGVEKVKKAVSTFVTNLKDSIVEAFDKYIKEPVSKAIKPVTDAVSGAWSSFTSAFEPFAKIFDAVKSGGNIVDIIKSYGAEGRKNANADADNLKSGPKPYEYMKPIKPIQHNIDSSELLRSTTNTTNNTTNNNATNKFVFYNQSDPRWSRTKIGDSSMAQAGCGPTSMAMAISQLTGEQITPDTIAKLGQEHLPGYAKYSLFPSVANKLNMNYTEGNDAGFIVRNLKNGVPVLLSGKSSASGTPYTTEGHVVTASHIKGNMVYIQDPRGDGYSRYYPINSLLTGMTKGMIITPSRATDVSKLSSGLVNGIVTDDKLGRQDLGLYGDSEDYANLNLNMGKTGAAQVSVADRVLSYARAFLANTSKFQYSQPKRDDINNNKNHADCSSFVSHVLSVAGDAGKVAGTSTTFWNNIGSKVSDPQVGDVVCQEGHVGLYSGNGNYIHMSGKKSGIKESKAIQNGNNKHRGYKRVLKNPSAMVDPTITGINSLLGSSIVATSSGQPITGGGDTSGATGTAAAATPAIDELGVFSKLRSLGGATLASIYNGKDMIDAYMNGTSVTDTSSSTSADGTIDYNGDVATAVWKFFTSKGYSKYATAGIMGNLQQESTLDPTRYQSGGGKGRGIAQWTVGSDRFKGLEAHAKSKGKDWKDLESQLEWIDLELGGKDPTTASILNKNYGGLSGLKNASSTKWAVEAFEKSFERAGTPMWEKRYSYADNHYNKFANAGAGDITSLAGMGPAMATSAQAAPSDGSIPDVMNGWKYYQQSDSRWGGKVGPSTVSRGGCGPTSAAMMLSTIFGKQINPLTMTKWANSNGTWTGAMQWTMPGKVASTFGLNMTTLGENANGVPANVLTKVKDALKAGRPVMLTGQGTGASGSNARTDTPFTPGGHVVLAVGLDGSGNVIINDPRGAGRTKAYTDTGILDVGKGLRGAWAFDTSGGSIPSSITTDGDFTGGGVFTTTGETTTTGTTTTPAIDDLGPFAKLKNLGSGILASIYNGGKDLIDQFMNPSSGDTTTNSGGSTSGGTLPVGDTNVDTNLMLSGTDGFFKALGPSAAAAYNEYHIFPSTTLAQAALESGWGKSNVAKTDKNLFGIKWTGNCAPSITVEKGLNCPAKEQGGARPYNRYKSYSDSMVDHGWFLGKYDRYKAALAATTPEEQIRLLGKSGYAEAGNYGTQLQNMVNKYNLTRYNSTSTAGSGDGNTYLVSPNGHAGMGDGSNRVTYHRSPNVGPNTTDIKAQRSLEEVNRKVNVAFNNINTSDPTAYAEILKLIMEELRAINGNTAATANGISNIEIVSSNTPINTNNGTTAERYSKTNAQHRNNKPVQGGNKPTGYDVARQIAGYKK